MAGYQLGWWDASGVGAKAVAGKGFRPALVFASAVACGGDCRAAAPAAAAVELLHNFTLVHDDVMDADPVRRGRPTVWRVWGKGNALLLGDALQAAAARVLAAVQPGDVSAVAVQRLADTTVELCDGQFTDCMFETQSGVGVGDYLQMAMAKTGSLMGCSCALGALLAGADTATVSALDTFGRELGLAFQCADDIIGIWGDDVVTGKTAGNDLARRKRSLPVIAALQSGTSAGAELAALYRDSMALPADAVAAATLLVAAAGGREAAQQQADAHGGAAISALPQHLRNSELATLASIAGRRDR